VSTNEHQSEPVIGLQQKCELSLFEDVHQPISGLFLASPYVVHSKAVPKREKLQEKMLTEFAFLLLENIKS